MRPAITFLIFNCQTPGALYTEVEWTDDLHVKPGLEGPGFILA